jgi:tetratricopeptide (TPR) repeat protein
MMLTLTRSFLLLLAMLLVAPASYAQSDDEPAEGEEVEEEADVPPEVPRVFKRAKKEFKKKNWALASIGFFSTITKEDEYFHSDARFFLAQCLDQMGLPVSSLEEYNRYFEGADPEDSNIGDALKAAVNLARRLDAGFIIAPGVSRLDTSAVGKGYRGPAMYWVGAWHLKNNKFTASKAYLSLVPKNTQYYARARMLEGIILTHPDNPSRNPALAIAPLAGALAAADRDAEDNTEWQVINLNLARTYYALGNFERAIEHFEKTPRSSALWHESLYEAAWSYFRLGRLSGALSHLQTVDSPFYDGTYHPDATLLRTLLFYYLCKYIDGQTMLNDFTALHYPMAKEMETAVKAARKDPTGLFKSIYSWRSSRTEDGIKLPEPVKQLFETDQDLVRVGDYLMSIQKELARTEEFGTGWEKSKLRKNLEAALKARMKLATDTKGAAALAKVESLLSSLQGHLGNAELYKVEMITAEKNLYDAAYQGRLLDKIAKRAVDPDVPTGYRFWPFVGEYWADELGWYEINTINECLEVQR